MDFARFDNVTLGFKRRPVLSNLNFSIYEGEFFGIVGGGRSGKTTLLRGLLGILKPQKGEIVVHVRPGEAGTVLPEGGFVNLSDTPGVMRFGYVPQRDSIDETFPLSVRDFVRLSRLVALGALHRSTEQDDEMVLQKLKLVGLSDNVGELYRDLSTDQKQRVLIARALATEARVIVLDEPFAGMNRENRRTAAQLLSELHSHGGITVVSATRHAEELPQAVQRVLLLQEAGGRIATMKETPGIFEEMMRLRDPETVQSSNR